MCNTWPVGAVKYNCPSAAAAMGIIESKTPPIGGVLPASLCLHPYACIPMPASLCLHPYCLHPYACIHMPAPLEA